MNRRHFIKAAALLGALTAGVKQIFASHTPDLPYFPEPPVNVPTRYDPEVFGVRPIFQCTGFVRSIGYESLPAAVEANDNGCLLLPQTVVRGHEPDEYYIYAPMPGFERTGPWYFLRKVTRREAKQSRYTIVAPSYLTSDLAPSTCQLQGDRDYIFDLSNLPVDEGQTHWRLYAPNTTHAIGMVRIPGRT